MIDHPVISADGHIDLNVLPIDVFTSAAAPSLRGRVPRVVDVDGVATWVVEDDVVMARVGGVSSGGRTYVPGASHRLDRMAEAGLYADLDAGIMRPAVAELRLADQDRDGIVAEVLYGILGAADKITDPALAIETCRIFNDWLSAFCGTAPSRLAGIAVLPSASPEEAAAELHRTADLPGLRGGELALRQDMVPLWRDDWDPVWQAGHETGLPVHLHTIGPPVDVSQTRNQRQIRSWTAVYLTTFQVRVMDHIASVIFAGVLERFPGLRLVLGESGIGWLPYLLERMDLEWNEQFHDLELTMPPSSYWRRQMAATFQIDPAGLAAAERIGVENIMWGNDFPHGDGVWPDSHDAIDKQSQGLASAAHRRIFYENARDLYGLA
jgi:predicted TIM-barrel fold metal-dependent hydrolase